MLRALLSAGYRVRALVRDDSRVAFDDDVEWTHGDLARSGDFAHALDGCRYLVHTAALYSFTPHDRAAIYDVNVNGTASLFAAAHLAGVERAVLTSSSAAIGHAHGDRVPDEGSYPPERPFAAQRGDYHASKVEQERAAFSSRLPVVAVLPTAPVGPGDWKPTPTGRLVRDFARGAIAALPPAGGGMNLVGVEDVATAHVSALERGRPGERYVLGGENLEMDAVWRLLSEVTGRPLPGWRAPYALAYAVAARRRGALPDRLGRGPIRALGGRPDVARTHVRRFLESAGRTRFPCDAGAGRARTQRHLVSRERRGLSKVSRRLVCRG